MLFEVFLKSGKSQLLQLHFEIQGQHQEELPFRMLRYYVTIYNKHKKPIVSTAILLDDSPSWRPDCFEQHDPFTGKLAHRFSFNVLKMLDYKGREEELLKERNVFALVILAQLAIMEAKNNHDLRKKHKLALAKKLFNSGLKKSDVSNLYKFIDWLIKLDTDHMKTFEKEVVEVAERESWQDWDPVYVSTFEQVGILRGMEKGLEKGRQEELQKFKNSLDRQLRRKFPHTITAQHLHLINEADSDTLSDWAENLVVANSIEDVFKN